MESWEEKNLSIRITRHQHKIYALLLYLIGAHPDEAYRLTVSVFAEVLSKGPLPQEERELLTRLAAAAVDRARVIRSASYEGDLRLDGDKPGEAATLRVLRQALRGLSYEGRAVVLLRDQLHFAYAEIGRILRVPAEDAQRITAHARIHLREKIEEVLRRG